MIVDWTSIDLEIDSELLTKVVECLVEKDESKSWKTLEKLVLSLPDFNKLCTVDIPMQHALHSDLGEKFAIRLVERLHWKKIDPDVLMKLMKKGFLDALSTFIIRKGKDKNIRDSPIVIATKMIINDGCKFFFFSK